MSSARYKRVLCADGFSVSIQAHDGAYCDPRRSGFQAYTSVELGYPNRPCPFIIDYAEEVERPTETVYGYVPASVVRKMLLAHGGIIEGECPPLAR